MKRLLILLPILLLLVACGENEYEKDLREAKESLEEAKEDSKRLEEISKQIDKTTESIEEVQGEMGIESEEENSVDDDDPMEFNTSEIRQLIEDVVESDLNNTIITELRVNEDASVDDKRYIILVDLNWNVRNGSETTKDMLDLYSDHLAASIADNELIHEIVLFWTVPYHNEDESILKKSYENKNDGMYLTDEMKDINIFD